ncbi:hypothetical protein I4U23_023969 [Adineta vaga]|nr:hypothetical protein I4U23_023969 [Adineta vaga]
MASSVTEVCDGENLAIILALYWVVYMLINAIIFAGAMYALQQYLEKSNGSFPSKSHGKRRHSTSRASSSISLVSGSKY